jgi:hypothetical protein
MIFSVAQHDISVFEFALGDPCVLRLYASMRTPSDRLQTHISLLPCTYISLLFWLCYQKFCNITAILKLFAKHSAQNVAGLTLLMPTISKNSTKWQASVTVSATLETQLSSRKRVYTRTFKLIIIET